MLQILRVLIPVRSELRTYVHVVSYSSGINDIAGKPHDIGNNSIDEINSHTNGVEFFGPSGTFPFLARLLNWSPKARRNEIENSTTELQKHSGSSNIGGPPVRSPDRNQLSLVSLLHNEDYPVQTRPQTPEEHQSANQLLQGGQNGTEVHLAMSIESPRGQTHQGRFVQSPSRTALSGNSDTNVPPFSVQNNDTPLNALTQVASLGDSSREQKIELEKECIRQYFSNLHLIHPILHRKSFLDRCENEVWLANLNERIGRSKPYRSHFLALYNAVCAVGAITAGDETPLGDVTANSTSTPFASRNKISDSRKEGNAINFPIILAKQYFEQAKLNLGDVFEICSLDSTQALFLMVIDPNVFHYHLLNWYNSLFSVRTL